MMQEFLYSKIHRATVTDANLNYVGSITVDEALMKAAKIREWQKVDILDVNNGERFQTYVIKGKENSGCICLNGAAARKVQPGDKVITSGIEGVYPAGLSIGIVKKDGETVEPFVKRSQTDFVRLVDFKLTGLLPDEPCPVCQDCEK